MLLIGLIIVLDMKKFLLYSSALTIFVVLVGLIVIFDIFDLSKGKSQLIGTFQTTENRVLFHNKIVEQVHNIGNLNRDIRMTYYGIQHPDEISFFTDSLKNLHNQRKTLENYMQQFSLQNTENELYKAFQDNYLPAVKDFENKCLNAVDFFQQQGFSKNNRERFENKISEAYYKYIEKHNYYSEILNKNRRY